MELRKIIFKSFNTPVLGFFLVLNLSSCIFSQFTPLDRETFESVLDTLIADPLVKDYATLEVLGKENLSVYSDYVAFHLFKGQPKLNGGIRSELSVDFPFIPGETVMYQWEVRIPEGFMADSPLNRWWVMAQWHDQPDKNAGETWEDFPSNSPPVAFYLGEIDNQLYFSPEYPGHGTQINELIPIVVGEWLQISVEILWSQNADGTMKVRFGGAQLPQLEYSGKNMLNGYQHYLKLGMYRHPDIATPNTVHLRRIEVKKVQ